MYPSRRRMVTAASSSVFSRKNSRSCKLLGLFRVGKSLSVSSTPLYKKAPTFPGQTINTWNRSRNVCALVGESPHILILLIPNGGSDARHVQAGTATAMLIRRGAVACCGTSTTATTATAVVLDISTYNSCTMRFSIYRIFR